MRIGIDFDNTIVCYDEVFHRLALERGLISQHLERTKQAVRDSLRSQGKERDWIELQGEVYGARMKEAEPFSGALEFIRQCNERGISYFIVSHKTEKPVAGQPYNLHMAARSWLASHGIPSTATDGVYFEDKRAEKLFRIKQLGCTDFIDDLPEFLTESQFPLGVQRLLFDPANTAPLDTRYQQFQSWRQISNTLLRPEKNPPRMKDLSVLEIAATLLAKAGLSEPTELRRLTGGVNNQVYCVETAEKKYALKVYFSHPNDPRDRIGVETSFTNHARSLGLDCLHHLVAFDRSLNAALYSFADGSRLKVTDVTEAVINQAIDFLGGLNNNRGLARDLPIASEASFSIHGHINTVDKRIDLLVNEVVDEAAQEFVSTEIVPTWQEIRSQAIAEAGERYFEELNEEDRCISPSDFGFHNAILGGNGKVHFVDFEYAGWDDPAHLLCDFFCQIAVPISDKFRPYVTSKLASIVSDHDWFKKRINILMPVYQLKWCCILLNDFLYVEGKRRAFAGLSDNNDRRQEQLQQSRILLAAIREPSLVSAAAQAE